MVDEEPVLFSLPELISISAFDLENFNTLLLNSIENKPLDATALKGVKNTLLESGSRFVILLLVFCVSQLSHLLLCVLETY